SSARRRSRALSRCPGLPRNAGPICDRTAVPMPVTQGVRDRHTASLREQLPTLADALTLTSWKPSEVAADVIMTEGHGTGIGYVVGLREPVEAELSHDRMLNLRLGGAPTAGEGLLDPRRRVADDGRILLRRGQHDDPACVGHQDRCARIVHVAVDL